MSFESVDVPGQFLRHSGYKLGLVKNDNSTQFAADATFLPVAGLAHATAHVVPVAQLP